MTRIFPFIAAAILACGGVSSALAQSTQTPAPAQAGDDPSMAQPKGSTQPALQTPQPVHNPESTVGLAPSEQPINNVKPRVAGQVVPSSLGTRLQVAVYSVPAASVESVTVVVSVTEPSPLSVGAANGS